MTGVDNRNLLPGLKLRRRNIGPVCASVSRQMDQAVIGAGPDAFDIKRRRRDGIDDTALARLGRWLRAVLSNCDWKFESLARQIRTNLLPVSATISRLPQRVGCEI